MKIRILPGGCYECLGPAPIEGRAYILEDAESGTSAQNRAFHALVAEYFASGCHSYNATTLAYFRDLIKRDLGAGFEAVAYSESKIIVVESLSMVPDDIRRAKDYKERVRGRLKSWSDYTKKERRETMDRLISEMHQAGVQTQKFYQILDGMEKIW